MIVSFFSMILGAIANASAGLILKKTVGLNFGSDFLILVIMSLLSYGVAFIFYAIALKEWPVYLVYVVMTGLATLFLVIYSIFFSNIKLPAASLLGIFSILLGILLIMKGTTNSI